MKGSAHHSRLQSKKLEGLRVMLKHSRYPLLPLTMVLYFSHMLKVCLLIPTCSMSRCAACVRCFGITSHHTTPHHTSPHLTSPHLTSPHLTSPYHNTWNGSTKVCLIVQAEEIAWQECSMSSLMPHFLHTVQQALLSSLPELDYAPIKFCNAWSVLMFALASVDSATTYAASRSGSNVL